MDDRLKDFEKAFINRQQVDSSMLKQILQIKRNQMIKQGAISEQVLQKLITTKQQPDQQSHRSISEENNSNPSLH